MLAACGGHTCDIWFQHACTAPPKAAETRGSGGPISAGISVWPDSISVRHAYRYRRPPCRGCRRASMRWHAHLSPAAQSCSTRAVKSGRRGAQLASVSIATVSTATTPETRDSRPRLRATQPCKQGGCRGQHSLDTAMSLPPRPPAQRTNSGTGCTASSPCQAVAASPWR